jgi:hypothetical protein
MVTYRYKLMDGRTLELWMPLTDNALPFINKRIEYAIRKGENNERKYVRPVPQGDNGVVRAGNDEQGDT